MESNAGSHGSAKSVGLLADARRLQAWAVPASALPNRCPSGGSVGSAAGVLLAGQLSVIIALADLGLDLGLLSSGLRAGAIMLVAVSAVVSPIGFRFLAPPLQSRPNDVGGRRLLGRS